MDKADATKGDVVFAGPNSDASHLNTHYSDRITLPSTPSCHWRRLCSEAGVTYYLDVEFSIPSPTQERYPFFGSEQQHRSASVLGVSYSDPPIDERHFHT